MTVDASQQITKQEVVDLLLGNHENNISHGPVETYAPANIALCKYWGKRDDVLNLPMTASLSLSLGQYGSRVTLSAREGTDHISLNGRELTAAEPFVVRVSQYLDCFRHRGIEAFSLDAQNTVPTAAGLASSASGFAALARAIAEIHGWALSTKELSILARLGSGSACRSVHDGLVEWQAGTRADGMDSYAEPIDLVWPELRIGIIMISAQPKAVGSREAMKLTVETSPLYSAWPSIVARDMQEMKRALRARDFDEVGSIAERNALAMHATMMGSAPPVVYWLPETLTAIHRIQDLRGDGMKIYFTMDAGPNVKLIYRTQEEGEVCASFPGLITTDTWSER